MGRMWRILHPYPSKYYSRSKCSDGDDENDWRDDDDAVGDVSSGGSDAKDVDADSNRERRSW